MKITRLAPLSALITATFASQAAVYEIVELPVNQQANYVYGAAINNDGKAAVLLQEQFRPAIDVSRLNLESTTLQENIDVDAVAAGNISDDDMVYLYGYLQNLGSTDSPSVTSQRFAYYSAAIADESGFDVVAGLDMFVPELNALSRSATVRVRDVADNGWVVGDSTAPLELLPYVNESDETVNYQVRDYGLRAFVNIDDQQIELLPEFTELGGVSAAYGLNNSRQVAGFSSIGFDLRDVYGALNASIYVSCNNDETRGDIPVEACMASLQKLSNFKNNATRWTLDEALQVIESKTYAALTTVEEFIAETGYDGDESNIRISSIAYGINDSGVMVGEASNIYTGPKIKGVTTDLTTSAAMFVNDEVVDISNPAEFYNSKALGINNTGLVYGVGAKYVNGKNASKLFIYDTTNESSVIVDGFFKSSSMNPRDMNESGQIVGEAEIDATFSAGSTRRKHAFLYDYNDGSFVDLNDLIACDSGYELVQADGINDHGEIVVTALKKREVKNIAGVVRTNTDGTAVESETPVVLKLAPIAGGQIQDCGTDESKQQRQGGVFGWLLLLAGLSVGLRRKFL